ncbi:MAG TPA: LysM peptidoglycan-binding domain-containing protein [Candidatus Limnocylindrales bacterium]
MDDRVGDRATAPVSPRDSNGFEHPVARDDRARDLLLLAERDALTEATRAFETPEDNVLAQASPIATTCPFFRAQLADGTLRAPIEAPHAANRCAAIGHPERQSPRQQNFVCLTAAHTDCPRFVRGALLARKKRPATRPVTTPTLFAILVLIAAAAASFGFVLVRGGLTLPGGADAIGLAAASGTPASSAPAAATAPAVAVTPATPRPTAVATPQPTPAPTASTTPSVAPTPSAPVDPTATPQASSSRYALLQPCATKPDCYTYTIRRGDNLTSIARYFGVSLATVRALNPWTQTSGISPGQQLVLPPPTR